MNQQPRNPRPVEVADTIDRAADYIMEQGWTYANCGENPRTGGVCPMVAIDKVTRSPGSYHAAMDTFRRYGIYHLPDAYSAAGWSVARWNDSQRDRRKVVRHMRKCARMVRNHELQAATP